MPRFRINATKRQYTVTIIEADSADEAIAEAEDLEAWRVENGHDDWRVEYTDNFSIRTVADL